MLVQYNNKVATYLCQGVKLFVIEKASEFKFRSNINPLANDNFHIECIFFCFQNSNAQI